MPATDLKKPTADSGPLPIGACHAANCARGLGSRAAENLHLKHVARGTPRWPRNAHRCEPVVLQNELGELPGAGELRDRCCILQNVLPQRQRL